MRFLVTGMKGQLGHDVMEELALRGREGVGVDVEEMDVTDAEAVSRAIREKPLDGVIHCAAYTAVDAAEDDSDLCCRVNADGTENIAKVCRELDLPMMYISTDYVFDLGGRASLGAGRLLQSAECVREEQISGRGSGEKVSGEILHRAHCLGVRLKRQ